MSDNINANFVMDYLNRDGGHHWSNLPNDLWWNLVSRLEDLSVDGIGFQNVLQVDDLPDHLSSMLRPIRLCTAKYEPYHGDSSPVVAVFDLTVDIRNFLLSKHFDQWNTANEQLPFDEVCFFRGEMLLILAIPYENMLLFDSLSRNDVRTLFAIDARFRSGLYYQDSHERVL